MPVNCLWIYICAFTLQSIETFEENLSFRGDGLRSHINPYFRISSKLFKRLTLVLYE